MLILPKDDLKKQEALHRIAKEFKKNKEYSEQEVNEVINSFDVEDDVLFRRELVNFNYLGKDSHRDVYWLKTSKLPKEKLDKISENQKRMEEENMY